MARPSNTDERRAQIVAALMRVMAVHGYEGATVARVAREAGLASGLVHYHFASKADILVALVDGIAGRAAARIAGRLEQAETPAGRVEAVIDAMLARGGDEDLDAVRCWSLIGAEAVKNADVRRLYGRFVTSLTERLSALLVDACHEAGRSARDVEPVAVALVAMIEGYFALAAAVPRIVPIGSAAAMARAAVRGFVAAQPSLRRRSA